MTPIPLSSFVDARGQDVAAKVLGSSQTAISKALKSGRLILIAEESPGVFSGLELKGFPSGGNREMPRLDLEEIVSQVTKFKQSALTAVDPSSNQCVNQQCQQ